VGRSREDQDRVRVELAPQSLTLGDLRNFSVARARGSIVAQWDDDDLCHPERLSRQVAHLLRHPGVDGCALARWTIAWPARDTYATSGTRPWEGSIVAHRYRLPQYPALRRGEDVAPIENMLLALLDAPELYVYRVHGDNTFDEPHFVDMLRVSTPLSGDEADRVRGVVARGGW
jgi:glycosyltransferase involved in cell wall biosynthesis